MINMFCFDCVYKHLAGALSYGKEILSGHDQNNALDHRIDFLGQLINAEHHLQLIDAVLFDLISNFRKTMQAKRIKINADDLDFIRDFYLKVQKVELKQQQDQTPYKDFVESKPDILFKSVKDIQYFKLSYDLIKKNLYNYNRIFVLKTDCDLTLFQDVIHLNQSLAQFVNTADNNFILMSQDTGFLKQFNAKQIVLTYTNKSVDAKTIKFLREQKIDQHILNYDQCKAQLIQIDKMRQIKYDGDFPITVYAYLTKQNTLYNDNNLTAFVDRKICCSLAQKIKNVPFVRWNNAGFESLKLTILKNKKR